VTVALVASALVLTGVGAYWFFTRNNSTPPTAQTQTTQTEAGTVQEMDDDTATDDIAIAVADEKLPGLTKQRDTSSQAKADTMISTRTVMNRVIQQQVTEAARHRYQQQVSTAIKQLEATTFGGKSGILGGVRDLNVQVSNPSSVKFKSIAVKVQYFKDNGGLYKSTVMYFNNVGPSAVVVRTAPDSPRGTRFTAQVLRADAEPDNSTTDSSQLP
jgi:serine/threonine-protein kinase